MQGQRGADNLYAETIDLNQGSVSNNNGSNPPTAWNSMLYPMDNHNIRSFGGWHIGESSSSTSPNLQPQGLGGNIKNESSFDTPPPVGPSNSLIRENHSRPLNGSSRMPLNINLNAEHETADAFPYNIENNDGSSSSFDDWGSSVKRKALDNASSNCYQQGETFDRHDFPYNLDTYTPPLHPSSNSHSEELSLRIGLGRGIASDAFPPINVTETGESSARNNGVRINRDNDRFNLPSTRNTMSLSEFSNLRHLSRPISPPDTFEFRPVSSSAHTPDLPRNMPPFAFHRAAERGFLSRDEENSMDHSPFAHFSEIRNNLNLSPENVRNPSPWATTQHQGSSRNVQRASQFHPWAPFPSADSEPGNWRAGHFPPLRSGQSSSEDMMMPPGVNNGHQHSTPFSRSEVMMGLPDDDISGWHALAANIEGRHRLVSEIRHVLNAMRRGDNLRDEDYMLFDPLINGIAELHDRHRDMRLDVDNMSYEELLALEERIGDVNTGLSEEAILRTLKQRKHLCLFDSSSSTLEPCSICREEYVLGDDVGELDCGHDFHTDCVKQWLTQKNICPICKMTALST